MGWFGAFPALPLLKEVSGIEMKMAGQNADVRLR